MNIRLETVHKYTKYYSRQYKPPTIQMFLPKTNLAISDGRKSIVNKRIIDVSQSIMTNLNINYYIHLLFKLNYHIIQQNK